MRLSLRRQEQLDDRQNSAEYLCDLVRLPHATVVIALQHVDCYFRHKSPFEHH